MKRKLVLPIIFMLLALCCFYSMGDTNAKYNTCDKITANLEENIDNYFLPAAYDISPFSDSDSVESALLKMSCSEFYEKYVVYDEDGKIIVPPIYTLFGTVRTEEAFSSEYYSDYYLMYLNYNKNNINGIDMTPSMWRVLHNGVSLDSAINAYIAPWTLYNNGELYTWIEIMEMSDDKLETLDFASYEFYTFISRVKEALVERGWWKEEYNERYNLLLAHKDDFVSSQPKQEIIVVNGENTYFSRINAEYLSSENPNITNIISVNIYHPDFKIALNNLDESVKNKYSQTVTKLLDVVNRNNVDDKKNKLNSNLGDKYSGDYLELYFYTAQFKMLPQFVDGISDEQIKSIKEYMQFITLIHRYDLSETQIRSAVEKFNYIFSSSYAIDNKSVDVIVNESKLSAVEYFKLDSSILLEVYDEVRLIRYDTLKVKNIDDLLELFKNVDDYGRLYDDLGELYSDLPSYNAKKENVKIAYDFVRENYDISPQTGDNSVLYVIIAAASLTAMSALVFRKKRKVTE